MSESLRFLATYRVEDWRMKVRVHHPDGTYLGETHTRHLDPTLVRGVAESYVAAHYHMGEDEVERVSIGVHGTRITPTVPRKLAVVKPRVPAPVQAAVLRGCPTPGKAAFGSRYDAERFLVRSWSRLKPGGYAAVRVYMCECSKLHLTSWSEHYHGSAA